MPQVQRLEPPRPAAPGRARTRVRTVTAVLACLVVPACAADVAGTPVATPTTVPTASTTTGPATSPADSTAAGAGPSAPGTTTTTAATTTTSSTTTSSTTTSSTTTSSTTTSSTTTTTDPPVPTTSPRSAIWEVRPPSDIPPPPIPDDWTVSELGPTHGGRVIEVWSRVPENASRRIVVIGGIHGNEPVSPPIVRSLVEVAYPDDVAIWLVPALNPDGVSAGTRANAIEVDLNRNFPWEWRPSDGGAAPLSEPESLAATSLINVVQPTLVVWVHQPLGYVSSIGSTPDAYEQAWSRGSGVPVRPDVTQHGGGESWTNLSAGFPSMLVEVDGWDATPEMVEAHRRGFVELLAVVR